nr:histidine kinase [Allomuricauda sp.]
MTLNDLNKPKTTKELLYQIGVALVLYLFYWYSQELLAYGSEEKGHMIIPFQIAFFVNYAVAAMTINYVLVPTLYSKGKILCFALAIVLIIALVIIIDEFVLEQIYFPKTRGTYFPGILFSLLETFPLIIAFVGFKFAWDYHRKQKEIENLKNLVRESELQFLKSQINPHFLFNNLNNLYVHAIDNSPETPNIIIELSSVLRYMLYDCKEQYTPLEKEISNLRHYTALNKLQIGDRGVIVFSIDGTPNDFVIAPLILIVFVENAFKHSAASQSEDIVIQIEIAINANGLLKFYCKNSYLPTTNIDNLDKGIGLLNVKKRLELLYDNAHELRILQAHDEYEVSLSIQLKRKE